MLSGRFLTVSFVKPEGLGAQYLSRCMACFHYSGVLRRAVPSSVCMSMTGEGAISSVSSVPVIDIFSVTL